jgi:hypothetical protein
MTERSLERALARKGADPATLARALMKSPEHVELVVGGLHSDTATVRFNSSKVLLALARISPTTLRPWIGSIVNLLNSENKILKSAAIRTLGHLATVDSAGRITRAMDRILEPIPGPDLVLACNAIEGAAGIARAKPKQRARIVEAILSVNRGRYRTPECRNIAIGKAIDALDGVSVGPAQREGVDGFVRRQRKNPRKSTRARAERFLRGRPAGGG